MFTLSILKQYIKSYQFSFAAGRPVTTITLSTYHTSLTLLYISYQLIYICKGPFADLDNLR